MEVVSTPEVEEGQEEEGNYRRLRESEKCEREREREGEISEVVFTIYST